jgi:hypothetical protein
MKLLIEVVATGEAAKERLRAVGPEGRLLGTCGQAFYVEREDGCFDLQLIQIEELEAVPKHSILRIKRLPD